jgi:hypothetical protein
MNFGVDCIAGMEKRGRSRLLGFDRWETEDTYEFWTRRDLCSKRWRPIGWGRANADQEGTPGNTWRPNHAAQRLARRDGAGNGHSHRLWSGVPAVYDVSDKRSRSRAALGVDFVIAVRRPQANTMTSRQLGMGLAHAGPAGSSDMDESLSGDQLSALSKARVFFERPQRGLPNDFTAATLWRPDRAKEYGSLFSPYWQARLADFSSREKSLLFAAMGLNPALAALNPGGR